jgi:hypothetical protein
VTGIVTAQLQNLGANTAFWSGCNDIAVEGNFVWGGALNERPTRIPWGDVGIEGKSDSGSTIFNGSVDGSSDGRLAAAYLPPKIEALISEEFVAEGTTWALVYRGASKCWEFRTMFGRRRCVASGTVGSAHTHSF